MMSARANPGNRATVIRTIAWAVGIFSFADFVGQNRGDRARAVSGIESGYLKHLSASKDHKAGAVRKNDTDLQARCPTTGKLTPK
jgi:hypothetical protein